MQELWAVWVAWVVLIGLSVAAQVLASRFGRRERKAGSKLDPLGVFDEISERVLPSPGGGLARRGRRCLPQAHVSAAFPGFECGA